MVTIPTAAQWPDQQHALFRSSSKGCNAQSQQLQVKLLKHEAVTSANNPLLHIL
jgi:hypothetical protein